MSGRSTRRGVGAALLEHLRALEHPAGCSSAPGPPPSGRCVLSPQRLRAGLTRTHCGGAEDLLDRLGPPDRDVGRACVSAARDSPSDVGVSAGVSRVCPPACNFIRIALVQRAAAPTRAPASVAAGCAILVACGRRCSSSPAASRRFWRSPRRTTRAAWRILSSTIRSRIPISIRNTSSGSPPTGRR